MFPVKLAPLILLLLQLIHPLMYVEASIPIECTQHNQTSRYDPLACWLRTLVVHIPDQSFHSGIIQLSIHDLMCTNFSASNIESTYVPSRTNDSTVPHINVRIHQLQAYCSGSYHVSGGLSGHLTARASAAPSEDSTALTWTGTIHSINASTNDMFYILPDAIESENCDTALVLDELHFTGSASAKIIDLFRKSISHYASNEIQSTICPAIRSTVDPLLTTYIRNVSNFLKQYAKIGERAWNHLSSNLIGERELENMSTGPVSTTTHRRVPAPEQVSLVNFLDDTPFFTSILSTTNDLVSSYLQRGILQTFLPPQEQNCSHRNCGFIFNGVNGLIHSVLEDGQLSVPVPKAAKRIHWILEKYGDLTLSVDSVSLARLDAWDKLVLSRPSGAQAFSSKAFTKAGLQLNASLTLVVKEVPGGVFQGDPLRESFHVAVNTSFLDASGTLELQLDKEEVQNITFGRIVGIINWLIDPNASIVANDVACLLQTVKSLQGKDLYLNTIVHQASFTPEFHRNVATRTLSSVGGQLERDLDAVLNNILSLFLTEYQPIITSSLRGMIQGPAQDGLNQFFKGIIIPKGKCPANEPYSPIILNFTRSPLTQLNRFLSQPYTMRRINDYLDCSSAYLSNEIQTRVRSWFLKATSNAVPSGLSFRLLKFELANVGSVQSMQVLEPEVDGMHLKSFLNYSSPNSPSDAISLLSRPQLDVEMELSFSPLNVSSTVNITILIDGMELEGGTLIRYDMGALNTVPLLDVLSAAECAIMPFDELELYGVGSYLTLFETVVNATMKNPKVGTIHLRFDSKSYPSVQALANDMLTWTVSSLKDVLGATATSLRANAEQVCQSQGAGDKENSHDDNKDNTSKSILLIVFIAFLLAQPGLLLLQHTSDSSHNQDDSTMTEPLLLHELTDAREDGGECVISEKMIDSPAVPSFMKVAVPIFILCSIALLVASNVSIGASVDIKATIDERTYSLPSVFSFGLLNTAREMLQARIYPLFLLVAVFSGIWPYMKLILMFISWIAPPERLSVESRGQLLLALDALGKFSLVDTYVLVLMMVAFRYHLQLTEDSALDVYVTPLFGFYGFLVATSFSLVAGHILVYYHRRREVTLHPPQSTTPTEPLCEFHFRVNGGQRQFSRLFQFILLVAWLAAVLLLGIGMTQKCFYFHFDGLAGMALDPDEQSTSYSLLSLGTSMPQSVEFPSIGIYGLQMAYFFYAVVAPFACLLALLALLVIPMSFSTQLVVLTIAEIGNAWSAVEVFALSVVAALLQISTFASFIVGDRCDWLDKVLEEGLPDNTSVSCYTVQAGLSWNACFLVAGVLLNSFVVSFALRLIHLAIHEKTDCRTSTSLETSHGRSSIVQQMAGSPWLSWVIADVNFDVSRMEDTITPVQGSQASSPQSGISFENEWRSAAEHDPAWKEWKEATSVT